MKIIIVGCGQVGEALAAELGGTGNSITVVDLSASKIASITSRLDVMGVVGNGATHTTLKEAGISNADLLIAVTESDELNLLCCTIAKRHAKCKVIARIQNPEYSSEAEYLKDELGLAMVINPEYAAAEEIARVLRFPAANKIETFSKGRVELIEFKLPEDSSLVGMSVWEVISKLKCDILVCAIERGDEAYIANGDFIFEGKDVISIIASQKKAADFFKKIGYTNQSIKSAMIIGATEMSHYLCTVLQKSGISLKVLDKDLSVCEDFSTKHQRVTVIHGEETDQELMIEEGAESVDAFISLTENDEQNIFLSLFAKSKSDGKIITKIDKIDYDRIIKHLDFDTTVYPKAVTSDMITRYVRSLKHTVGSDVETMYSIVKGKVEATEFVIKPDASIIGVPLSSIKFKDDVLVAAILRKGTLIIPRGNDTIQADDSVVIVSKILGLKDISAAIK